VAPRLRFPVAVVAVLAGVGVIVLGVHFAGDTHAGPLDRTLGSRLDMRHGLVKFLGQGFADLGNPLPVAVALVVLAATAFAVRGPRGLALALVGPLLAMAMTSLVLKPLVDRTRSGELAFPSGHTTAIASMAVAAGTLLLGWTIVSRLLRYSGAVALALLVVAVGASMVGRGYHYPTDTLGGVGVALAVVLLVALAADVTGDRARSRRGRAPATPAGGRTTPTPVAAPPRPPRGQFRKEVVKRSERARTCVRPVRTQTHSAGHLRTPAACPSRERGIRTVGSVYGDFATFSRVTAARP
jgi:membrane-associated phospholipid phosphatase